MRDIPYTIEDCERKIKILTRNKEIDEEIDHSSCPICGGKLEYILYPGGGDSIIIPYSGEIKCTRCGMFSKTIERSSYESYHWKYDGSSEISLKEDVWSSVKGYVRKEQL